MLDAIISHTHPATGAPMLPTSSIKLGIIQATLAKIKQIKV
jgi:hypothetical protein